MKINIRNVRDKLITLMIISVFFEEYCFFYIKTYPVTLFTVFSVLVLIIGFYDTLTNGMKINKNIKYALIMMVYVALNFLIKGFSNITSFLLCEFLFFCFIFMKSLNTNYTFEKFSDLFSNIMNVLSIYGIYQLFANLFHFPFGSIIIKNHMVTGYNLTNKISIGGILLTRSNAMFREPAYFAQYLAINILFYIVRLIENKKEKSIRSYVFFLILNGLAFITTFSGTGIFLLFFTFFIYILLSEKSSKKIKRIVAIVFIAICGALLVFVSPLGEHFLSRTKELFVYNENQFSGYVRFAGAFDVLFASWRIDPIFGTGIGTVKGFISSLVNAYAGMTVNGLCRVGAELGIIGLIIWILFLLSFVSQKENEDIKLVLGCSFIPYIICQEVFQLNYFWLFLFLLSCEKKKSYIHKTPLLGGEFSKCQ